MYCSEDFTLYQKVKSFRLLAFQLRNHVVNRLVQDLDQLSFLDVVSGNLNNILDVTLLFLWGLAHGFIRHLFPKSLARLDLDTELAGNL